MTASSMHRAGFATAVGNAFSAYICILDRNGQIIAVNHAWQNFGAANSRLFDLSHIGRNYLEINAPTARRLRTAFRQSLQDFRQRTYLRPTPMVKRPLKRTLQSQHQAKSEEEAMMEPGPILKNQLECEADRSAKAGPGLGLSNRQNKAVRFLGKHHPEPQPTSVIPGVSDITMEELIDRNAVAEVRDPNGKERVFVLMASGEDEVRRLILQDQSHREGPRTTSKK